jgi:hypothetical protein
MNNTKNVIILAVALVLSVCIYCLSTRYQAVTVATRDYSRVYLYDRLSGKVWVGGAGLKLDAGRF